MQTNNAQGFNVLGEAPGRFAFPGVSLRSEHFEVPCLCSRARAYADQRRMCDTLSSPTKTFFLSRIRIKSSVHTALILREAYLFESTNRVTFTEVENFHNVVSSAKRINSAREKTDKSVHHIQLVNTFQALNIFHFFFLSAELTYIELEIIRCAQLTSFSCRITSQPPPPFPSTKRVTFGTPDDLKSTIVWGRANFRASFMSPISRRKYICRSTTLPSSCCRKCGTERALIYVNNT